MYEYPKGERTIYLDCRCGHRVRLRASTHPDLFERRELKDGVVERLRCSVCGRRGRPESVIVGWSE